MPKPRHLVNRISCERVNGQLIPDMDGDPLDLDDKFEAIIAARETQGYQLKDFRFSNAAFLTQDHLGGRHEELIETIIVVFEQRADHYMYANLVTAAVTKR